MSYDPIAASQKRRAFQSRLTRLLTRQDHQKIIDLWQEFETYYQSSPEPMPDLWRRWKVAAEEAEYTLVRQGRQRHA